MTLFEKLQEQVKIWREHNYQCVQYPQIKEILNYNKLDDGGFRYLRRPQFEAIETYLYLRFVLKTPQTIELYKTLFADDKLSLFKTLGISHVNKDAIDDVDFTGSINDIKKTDFYFEYKGEDGKYHNYFPDFIITKTNGEFLIVEIKAKDKEKDKEVLNKKKAVSYLEGIEENKFKYVIIYTDEKIEDNNEGFLKVRNYIN